MNRYYFLILFLVFNIVLMSFWLYLGQIKTLKTISNTHSSALIRTNEQQRREKGQAIPRISLGTSEREEKIQLLLSVDANNKKLDEEMPLKLLDEKLRESLKKINEEVENIGLEDELISLLDDLENKLHAFNTANEFIRINGISEVIVPCLNANSTRVRSAAARALGAAISNIETAQIAAIKAGVMTPLLKNIALEKEYEIRSCSLYALSSLVYGFPTAEIKFVEEGGLSILLSVFDEDSVDALKLQLRVVTFFSELFLEREDAGLTAEEGKSRTNGTEPTIIENIKKTNEKLRQYDSVGLSFKLLERGWCSKLSYLLVTKVFKKQGSGISEEYIDYDIADKILVGVSAVSTQCESQFKNDVSFRTVLKELRARYKFLVRNHNNSFFRDRYILVDKLYSIFVN